MAGELIERHMLAPFVWGQSDCCLAVCAVLRDSGRCDPGALLRGRYHDAAGARAVLGGPVSEAVPRLCDSLGWPEVPPGSARDLDIGLIGESVAIHAGGWWHAKSKDGYACLRRVRRAWRSA